MDREPEVIVCRALIACRQPVEVESPTGGTVFSVCECGLRETIHMEVALTYEDHQKIAGWAKAFASGTPASEREVTLLARAYAELAREVAEERRLLRDCFELLKISVANQRGAFANAVTQGEFPRFQRAIDAARAKETTE